MSKQPVKCPCCNHEFVPVDVSDVDKMFAHKGKNEVSPTGQPVHDIIARKIMALCPHWNRPVCWTQPELYSLHIGLKVFDTMLPNDWELHRDYLAAERRKKGVKVWPRTRQQYCEHISDVDANAVLWAEQTRWRPKSARPKKVNWTDPKPEPEKDLSVEDGLNMLKAMRKDQRI